MGETFENELVETLRKPHVKNYMRLPCLIFPIETTNATRDMGWLDSNVNPEIILEALKGWISS